MNDVLKILYIVCFIIAALSFCTAIFIFFKFRIVEVVQDLNGTLTRQAIEKIRERNEHAKNYGADLLDIGAGQTGKTGRTGRTGRMGLTGRTGTTGRMGNTGNMGAEGAKNTGPIVLSSLQNQGQSAGSAQDGTTLLQSNRMINKDFVIIKNIVFINTSESI